LEDLVLEQDRGLTWFQSSARARRGFCAGCGSSLFWEPLGKNTISISAGTLEPPTGLKTVRHIYVAAAGDYYDISDNLEKLPAGMEE
jgi:hypothetical protein